MVVYGEEIKLTPIEFDILYLLASNPGRVFSTDEIFEKVWNEKVYEANNTVMVHIRRLRGKMKEDTRQNKIITTVWGVGYKIENDMSRSFYARLILNILYSTVIACLVEVFLITNVSMLVDYLEKTEYAGLFLVRIFRVQTIASIFTCWWESEFFRVLSPAPAKDGAVHRKDFGGNPEYFRGRFEYPCGNPWGR